MNEQSVRFFLAWLRADGNALEYGDGRGLSLGGGGVMQGMVEAKAKMWLEETGQETSYQSISQLSSDALQVVRADTAAGSQKKAQG